MYVKKRKFVSHGDIIVITVLALLPLYFLISQKKKEGKYCTIKTPEKTYTVSLERDTILKVEGRIGVSEVEIKKGKVRMRDSPCHRKYCMKMGWIKNEGEDIICVPNGIIIKVEGEKIDGITR